MKLKKTIKELLSIATIVAFLAGGLGAVTSPASANGTFAPEAMVLQYDVPNFGNPNSRVVTLPLYGTVNATIDWGDGSPTQTVTTAGNVTKIYAQPAGTFNVSITGTVGRYGNGVNAPDSNSYLKKVIQFGTLTGLTSLSGAFANARDLNTIPATLPAGVTDISHIFNKAWYFNGDVSGWNTSAVTNMAYAFSNTWNFNQNIGSWNTSNVTNMTHMFENSQSVAAFNQDLSSWDVSKVTDMAYMFQNCWKLNQDFSNWNTGLVTDMSFMFNGAQAFNKALPQAAGKWNTSNVTNMQSMFSIARVFNQPIDSWDTSKVTNMSSMFYGANAFDQNLNSWNTSNVTNMSSMFFDAGKFKGNISSWNVGKVTNFSSMFRYGSQFNSDISGWDTSAATTLELMFESAIAFNQNVGNWNVSNVTNLSQTFSASLAFNQDISSWNIANVTNMYGTFMNARAFNQNIGSWNTAKVTSLQSTFNGAWAFNQDITGWDVSKVTNFTETFSNAQAFNQQVGNWNTVSATTMAYMFRGAQKFNHPLAPVAGKWNTSNVTDMQYMFSGASVFNQNLADWDTAKVTNMSGMFQNTNAYDLPLPQVTGKWVTTNVTTMAYMFDGAAKFNQDISNWNTAKVTTMRGMFKNTPLFNLPLPQVTGQWTTANVTDLAETFNGAALFDQDLSSWDTSRVTTLNSTFTRTGKFNQSLTAWNTARVTDMYQTFAYSKLYNQPLPTTANGWTTAAVTQMAEMFRESEKFNQPLNTWDVSKVTTMYGMFQGARAFDNDVSTWNTGNVTQMQAMFSGSIFNQDISQWNTSRVQYMYSMFSGNTKFNMPIDDWNVSAVQNAFQMFEGASAFNQPIYKWSLNANTNTYRMFAGATSFDMDLSRWNTSNVNDMTQMFSNSGIQPAHWSAYLDAQANGTPARRNNIRIDSSSQFLCEVADARAKLTRATFDANPGKGWIVYDSGQATCKTPQTLTFQDIDTVAQTNSFPVNKVQPLTATATSGLATTFKWISGPCQVSGNKLTASPGSTGKTCVVAAQQAGNATYSDAVQELHWISIASAVSTYSVVYDVNQGTGSVSDATTYFAQDSATVLGKGNVARTGHRFLGWNTQPDGSGTSYAADDVITIVDKDVLLFANWEAIATYSYNVTFDLGSGDSGSLASISGNDVSLTLPNFSTGNMVKAGYSFNGWFDESMETSYEDGETITLTEGFNRTLTAMWLRDLTPPGTPDAPTLTAGIEKVTVTVTPPTTGGEATSYLVTLSPGGATCTITAPAVTCDIADLDPTIAYTATVVASNEDGDSAVSAASASVNPISNKPGTPDAPTLTAGAGKLTATVTPPTTGGEATSYLVTLSPGGKTCTVIAPALTCDVTGLDSTIAYTSTVVAINEDGESSPSVASAAVTPQIALPGTPSAPTVVTGDAKVTVTATPSLTGGAATSLKVTASPGGAFCVITLPATSCVITGLTNNTSYTFTTVATNASGDSAASPASASVTPSAGDDGKAPKTIPSGGASKFVSTNDSSFQLAWDKKNGKLISRATGIYTGYIEAKITFTKGGTVHTCSAVFGDLKVLPQKTAAQKAAAMKMKTFTGKQFCIDKTKLNPATLNPRGGMTPTNFKKIKPMNKSTSELSKEKAAAAALKNFTGQVSIQVIRYRAWPTTMVNLGDHNSKGGIIPPLVRGTKVTLG